MIFTEVGVQGVGEQVELFATSTVYSTTPPVGPSCTWVGFAVFVTEIDGR